MIMIACLATVLSQSLPERYDIAILRNQAASSCALIGLTAAGKQVSLGSVPRPCGQVQISTDKAGEAAFLFETAGPHIWRVSPVTRQVEAMEPVPAGAAGVRAVMLQGKDVLAFVQDANTQQAARSYVWKRVRWELLDQVEGVEGCSVGQCGYLRAWADETEPGTWAWKSLPSARTALQVRNDGRCTWVPDPPSARLAAACGKGAGGATAFLAQPTGDRLIIWCGCGDARHGHAPPDYFGCTGALMLEPTGGGKTRQVSAPSSALALQCSVAYLLVHRGTQGGSLWALRTGQEVALTPGDVTVVWGAVDRAHVTNSALGVQVRD